MMLYEKELDIIHKASGFFRPHGSFVAGGAITSAFTASEIRDVDLYFKTRSAFIEAIQSAYDEGFWCIAVSSRAVTFSNNGFIVQLMFLDWYPDAASIFSDFDFTCCMAAYDNDAKAFVFHDDFLVHASQRHLKFHNGTRYPFASLMRVIKYQARGYTIGKAEILRIALACHKMQLNSWDDLREQIGGMYGDYAKLNGTGDFSIDAAIAAMDNCVIDAKIPKDDENYPDADSLLTKIFGEDK